MGLVRIQVWTCMKTGYENALLTTWQLQLMSVQVALSCVHTHLGSSELDFLWAKPCSWWADGCADTEIPILSCMKFHTYIQRHWQSLQETSPVVSCSGSCTRSRRQWQNQPGSERVGLHPREHLSPTCKEKYAMPMSAPRLTASDTLLRCLLLRTKGHNWRYNSRG